MRHVCSLARPDIPTATITEPIEFDVRYEVWPAIPVVCEPDAIEQTGTFLTNECFNLTAAFGKFTLEASSMCIVILHQLLLCLLT